eukprot:c27836_g1_i1 orf=462-3575(-)
MDSHVPQYPVTVALEELNKVIQDDADASVLQKENPRRLVSFVEMIQLIILQLDNVRAEDLPPPILTALTGITADLQPMRKVLAVFRFNSRLYLLTHSRPLCKRLEEISHSIGNWLSLLAIGIGSNSELYKKTCGLSVEMKQSQFLVTETEEHICVALEKVAQDGITNNAVQNAIMMDIARALGIGAEDRSEVTEQYELLKKELEICSDPHILQIRDALDIIFNNWTIEPQVFTSCIDDGDDVDQNVPIPPFKPFLCPLTKQVMKNPVMLVTGHTYEQSAIEEWFKHCLQQGQEPSCPLTGITLTSLEFSINFGLQQTIQEWYDRNVEFRIQNAISNLQSTSLVEDFERAVDEVHTISEENPLNKYTLRKNGVIPLLLGVWQRQHMGGSVLRSKALDVLHSMVLNNDENKVAIVEANALKYAVKSLTSSFDKEKESAAGLLLELSSHSEICARIGSEKAAILLLSGAASNAENVALSDLADQTLKRLEELDLNVLRMADIGRLKPLLDRLCEGPEERQVRMAEYLAQMTLSNRDKELIAKRGATVLVNMLLSEITKEVSLKALLNISRDDGNSPLLIHTGILPPLLNILAAMHTTHMPNALYLKEIAAETIANLVSKPGHWEVAIVDPDGNTMQSEVVVHKLLQLMTRVGTHSLMPHLLQALYGILSSPQAADAAAIHIQSGNGIRTLVFMQDQDAKCHVHVLMILNLLSERIATDVAKELRNANWLPQLKEILKGSCKRSFEERVAAAGILANVPLTEDELVRVLGIDLVGWIATLLREPRGTERGRSSSLSMAMVVGLLGLLCHFARSSNVDALEAIREHRVMMLFNEYLLPEQVFVKQRAARGLQLLSEKGCLLATENSRTPNSGCCVSFLSLCRISQSPKVQCPVHGFPCTVNDFCLVEAGAVRPLIELLEHNNVDVQMAAVGALSTLLSDGVNLRGGVEELLKADGIQPIFDLFYTVRPGELQDKTVLMVERILHLEEYAQKYSIDQGLVKALVEAFRNGNQMTKNLAQNALMALKELSGVAGRATAARSSIR